MCIIKSMSYYLREVKNIDHESIICQLVRDVDFTDGLGIIDCNYLTSKVINRQDQEIEKIKRKCQNLKTLSIQINYYDIYSDLKSENKANNYIKKLVDDYEVKNLGIYRPKHKLNLFIEGLKTRCKKYGSSFTLAISGCVGDYIYTNGIICVPPYLNQNKMSIIIENIKKMGLLINGVLNEGLNYHLANNFGATRLLYNENFFPLSLNISKLPPTINKITVHGFEAVDLDNIKIETPESYVNRSVTIFEFPVNKEQLHLYDIFFPNVTTFYPIEYYKILKGKKIINEANLMIESCSNILESIKNQRDEAKTN